MSEKPNNSQSEFDASVDYGVMYDKLNLGKIVFWSVLGIVILVVMIVGVSNFYHFNKFQTQQAAAIATEFHEITNLKNNANDHLQTTGVSNYDDRKFHIPIESAISIYLNESE